MSSPERIFLSYAHPDADGVGRIYQQLKDRGYKPRLDREDLQRFRHLAGAVAKVVRNWKRRGLRKHEGIVLGGEVNGLSDRHGGDRLPAVDLPRRLLKTTQKACETTEK